MLYQLSYQDLTLTPHHPAPTFGGPFTTEQVEDTKSFFKVVSVLLAIGPVYIMDVLSSNNGLMLFGFHTDGIHIVDNTYDLLDN